MSCVRHCVLTKLSYHYFQAAFRPGPLNGVTLPGRSCADACSAFAQQVYLLICAGLGKDAHVPFTCHRGSFQRLCGQAVCGVVQNILRIRAVLGGIHPLTNHGSPPKARKNYSWLLNFITGELDSRADARYLECCKTGTGGCAHPQVVAKHSKIPDCHHVCEMY